MSRLTASRAAFDLIASFEGYRTRAVMAPGGKWTLGFGHTATAREGLSVSRAEAEDLLRWDLLPIEDSLRQVALTPLTQNQFDALTSFAFNIGLENFKKSDVLKYLNQGQPVAAALSMHAWRRARVNGRVLTIDALVRRRAAEAALFLEPVGARAAAPTSIVSPEVDDGALVTISDAFSSVGEFKVQEGDDQIGRPSHPSPIPVSNPSIAPVAPQASTETEKPVVMPANVAQDVVRAPILPPALTTPSQPIVPPRVTPALQIPPPTIPKPPLVSPPVVNSPRTEGGPILPNGISPFPGGPVYEDNLAAANGQSPSQGSCKRWL